MSSRSAGEVLSTRYSEGSDRSKDIVSTDTMNFHRNC